MKRWHASVGFAAAAALLLVWLSMVHDSPRLINAVRSDADRNHTKIFATPTPSETKSDPAPDEDLNLAGDLNASNKTIREDLKLLDSVFSVWQTNFLRTGNPVGTNAEITAALTGKNTLHTAFISPRSAAINRAGELCDRWGTPFFFHQLSGNRMEIISAGPDRRRGTADDSELTP